MVKNALLNIKALLGIKYTDQTVYRTAWQDFTQKTETAVRKTECADGFYAGTERNFCNHSSGCGGIHAVFLVMFHTCHTAADPSFIHIVAHR